jgi:hypothetical protein
MDSFSGDVFGNRCYLGKKSSDVLMIILISRRECRYPSLAGVYINLRQLRSTTIGKGTWNGVSVDVAHTMTSLVAMMDMVLLTGVWTLK